MDLEVLQRTVDRERKRRDLAKRSLEEKSRELYYSYRQLEEAHSELQANKDQLVQSEKMASLGVMAAGVAHEINNPVGFVNSNLNTLKEYVESFSKLANALGDYLKDPGDELRQGLAELYRDEDLDFILEDSTELLADCSNGLGRVQGIVSGLKTFSHTGQGELAPMDLVDCLKETMPIVRAQLDHPCKITERLVDVPLITGNSGRLCQVFTNLLVNATQAVEGREDAEICVETRQAEGGVEVRVSDNGCGISPENQEKLFQPFFTTKAVGKGTGLGLSISHGIVHEHGGSIHCESKAGEGTTFIVLLPHAVGASERAPT